MRLLIDAQCIQSTSSLRGIGRYALALTKSLVQEADGHQVEVLLNSGDDPARLLRARAALETFLPPAAVHVFDAPWPWAPPHDVDRRPAAAAAYAAAVRSLRPDALLVLSPFEGDNENVLSIGLTPQDPPAAAILFDLIPALDPGTYLLGPGAKDYWRRLDEVRRCSLLLAISAYSGRQAAQVLGQDCPTVVPIWGGPFPGGEFPHFEPGRDDHPDLVVPSRFLLSVGGDHPRKNLDRLVAAWGGVPSALRDEHPLVIACRLNPGTVRRLRRLSRRVGVEPGQLVLAGGVSEATLQRLYRTASAFVFPSTEEGLGMPPLEAMAAGCPTVLARGSSLDELCDDDAAYFDGLSTAAITSAVTRVLEDGDLRERLRAAAARSAERFTWGRSARLAWEALAALPSAHPAPARPPYRLVGLRDRAAVDAMASDPAALELDADLPSGELDAAGFPAQLRRDAAPAVAVVTQDAAGATRAVRSGLLGTPVVVGSAELETVGRHDFYADYAAGLADTPLSATTARSVVDAVSVSPRWTLERPRPVWLLAADTPVDGLQDAAADVGVDLAIGTSAAVGLGAVVDVLLVPGADVANAGSALAHARQRGTRVVAVHAGRPVPTPDWCEDLALDGPLSLVSSWAPHLAPAAARWGRTTGWPWRVRG